MSVISAVYIFDGSLEGLLTAVFERFERKPSNICLKTAETFQPDAFLTAFQVTSQPAKANRVWAGLIKRLEKAWIRKIYCAYLSETPEMMNCLFQLICYLFQHPQGAENNYGNEWVLAVSQMATKVEREKHRMEAFIRFQHTADGLFYCGISPDFNVIPLIVKHFKDRYADQKWIIYDLSRSYGIYYNLNDVEEIEINKPVQHFKSTHANLLDPKENQYAELWKNYFKSTNIVARKNTKLHLQHVPKRYWKYLTEKQI